MIPPAAQRSMAKRAGATTAKATESHAIYISKPKEVVALIGKAAKRPLLRVRRAFGFDLRETRLLDQEVLAPVPLKAPQA
jgi:hypothetical protein